MQRVTKECGLVCKFHFCCGRLECSIFIICRWLSYWPTNLRFCLTFPHLRASDVAPIDTVGNPGCVCFSCANRQIHVN